MKKKMYLVLAVVLATAMLSACTKKEASSGVTAGTGNTATATSDTANKTGEATASGTSDNGAAGSTASNDASGSADSTANTSGDAAGNAADASGSSNAGADSASTGGDVGLQDARAELTYDELNQGEQVNADGLGESTWSGTYESPNDSVTITAADDGGSFSFIFSKSGIGGTATCDVNQGIFEGDDNYVLTFNLDGDSLEITVSSPDDENAGDSVLNGTYTRQ